MTLEEKFQDYHKQMDGSLSYTQIEKIVELIDAADDSKVDLPKTLKISLVIFIIIPIILGGFLFSLSADSWQKGIAGSVSGFLIFTMVFARTLWIWNEKMYTYFKKCIEIIAEIGDHLTEFFLSDKKTVTQNYIINCSILVFYLFIAKRKLYYLFYFDIIRLNFEKLLIKLMNTIDSMEAFNYPIQKYTNDNEQNKRNDLAYEELEDMINSFLINMVFFLVVPVRITFFGLLFIYLTYHIVLFLWVRAYIIN